MSLFNKIFGGNSNAAAPVAQNAPKSSVASGLKGFGRYTDINKNRKQLDGWKNANDQFKAKNFVDSFEQLLIYIKDEEINNVSYTRTPEKVEFEIIQGSKVIRGVGDANRFFAEGAICLMEQPSIPVMRKLMSLNYSLRYSNFALTGQKLVLKFSSHSMDASPGKLYDALKELATKADQQDDLLLQEFSSLKEFDVDSIIEWPANIKEAKYNTLVKMIAETKEKVAKEDANYMSGGIAYLLLNLTYEIDYLIAPHGKLTDALEKIQHLFFAKNNMTTTERNNAILLEYDKIVAMPKDKVEEGIYDVKSTFAIAKPANHKTVMDFMFAERNKTGWYKDNNYPHMVDAIYGYMVSYSFFNFGMVYPVSKILNVAMAVINPDFYELCGSSPRLNTNGVLNGSLIAAEINGIVADAKKDYPHLAFNTATLNYTSVSWFIDSLIVELDKINLSK